MRYFKPRKNLEYSDILCPQKIEKVNGHDRLFVYRQQNGDIAKIPTPDDYTPDAYKLKSDKGILYEFVPHKGFYRIN